MKFRIVVVLIFTSTLAACGTPAVENNPSSFVSYSTKHKEQPRTDTAVISPYVIDIGDELAIKFYLTPELDDLVQVQPDGHVNLRLVGSIKAEGKTPAAMTAELEIAYGAELENPQIAVIAQNLRDFQIFVGGEVDKPQAIDLTPGMTPLEAIIGAGGATESADLSSMVLIRQSVSGQPMPQAINLKSALKNVGDTSLVTLQPLDIVYVPKSRIANLNKFVDDYVTNLLLIRGINLGYDLGNDSSSSRRPQDILSPTNIDDFSRAKTVE